MSEFPVGTFRRERLPGALRRFCPAWSAEALVDVSPESLLESGKKLVLLDVDNTLLPWRSEEIPPSTLDWMDRCRKLGLELCILSNTRHPDRLKRLSERMGVPFLLGKFKPNPSLYFEALERFGRKPEEAVMIGDQIFTDMWGANRSGIDGIWVRPSSGRDFIGTKVSRMGERILRPFLRSAMQNSENEQQQAAPASMLDHPTVRQFAKFVIVGGMSTVIDLGLNYILMFVVQYDGVRMSESLGSWLIANYPGVFSYAKDNPSAALPLLKGVSSGLAIVNSFIWNRRWTFRIVGPEERGKQFRRFVFISVMGLLLNNFITTGLNNIIAGHAVRSWAVASAVATVAVAFWNFFGQKLWAFQKKQA